MDYYLKPTNVNKLCALIAYYPTSIPDASNRFPGSVRVLVHLVGPAVDVITPPQGPKHKRVRKTKQISAGIGTGDRLDLGYLAYVYQDAGAGFAERDLEQYDRVSAELAWSRTLNVLQGALSMNMDVERFWEDNQESKRRVLRLSFPSQLFLTLLCRHPA